jgi:hypothetical protein
MSREIFSIVGGEYRADNRISQPGES